MYKKFDYNEHIIGPTSLLNMTWPYDFLTIQYYLERIIIYSWKNVLEK